MNDSIKALCQREFDVSFTNDTEILNVNRNGFTLKGASWLYIINRYNKARTQYNFADIAAQNPEFASWNESEKTFILNLDGGEKCFGFDIKSNQFKVEKSLSWRTNSFVVLHWVYYKQYGGKIVEHIAAKEYLSNKDGYMTDTQLKARAFNSTYHNGADDFANVCKRYSALFYGDIVNGIPAVDDCEAFLWFTDPHLFTGSDNGINEKEDYIGQIQKIYNSTPTTFALCGGDWLGHSDTPDMACFKLGYINGICKSMFDRCYMLVGNHDTNYQGKKDADSATYSTRLSRTAIKNLWYRDTGKAYYDFYGTNTHFYCFDTGIENQELSFDNNYGYEQAEWFAENLMKDTSKHIALAAHIYYYNSANVVQPLTKILLEIASAYNRRAIMRVNGKFYNFSGVTGRVEFMLAGHSHEDYTVIDGIPVVVTLDCGNKQTYTADCSFDLVFVDYDHRKIKCIRAGVGSDREINLDN